MNKILISQPDLTANSVRKNLEILIGAIDVANSLDCNSVLFPEMCLTGYEMGPAINFISLGDSYLDDLSKHCALSKVEISLGVALKIDHRRVNAVLHFDAMGTQTVVAEKLHLFNFAGEHRYFAPGNALGPYRFGDFRVLSNICFDLRFWDSTTPSAVSAAQLIVNHASWPAPRMDHYELLLRARSMDTGLPVIGVNRTGRDSSDNLFEPVRSVYYPDGSEQSFYELSEDLFLLELDSEIIGQRVLPFVIRQGEVERL